MSGKSLTRDERKAHLEALAAIPIDADTDDLVLRTFLPGPQHERALDRRVLVVRGDRGAGKTALFELLHAVQHQDIPLSKVIRGAPDGRRIDGFSAKSTAHPAPDVLEQLAAGAGPHDLRAFWLGHLAGRLSAEGVAGASLPDGFREAYHGAPTAPSRWVPQARASLAELYAWLDEVERTSGETCFVVYDHLDQIGALDRAVRHKVSAGLLGLWLPLALRYSRISGKVLLREDLFQATLTSFADATKLEARSVRIDWNAGRLLALLVRRMAADSGLRGWLEEVTSISLARHKHLGWMPPPELDEREQKSFGHALVGPYMGAGPTKGFSHTWLINHLQDALLRVTPRSLLALVRAAAELALDQGPRAAYRRLLAPVELQQSLEKASLRRVRELTEDYPVVGRLEGLRDATLFLTRREVVKALGSVKLEDGFQDDADGAFEELLRVGVLADREGRIDVPDIYRYGFGIKRKGGTRRVT